MARGVCVGDECGRERQVRSQIHEAAEVPHLSRNLAGELIKAAEDSALHHRAQGSGMCACVGWRSWSALPNQPALGPQPQTACVTQTNPPDQSSAKLARQCAARAWELPLGTGSKGAHKLPRLPRFPTTVGMLPLSLFLPRCLHSTIAHRAAARRRARVGGVCQQHTASQCSQPRARAVSPSSGRRRVWSVHSLRSITPVSARNCRSPQQHVIPNQSSRPSSRGCPGLPTLSG